MSSEDFCGWDQTLPPLARTPLHGGPCAHPECVFVNEYLGDDVNDGRSPDRPVKTITRAFGLLAARDRPDEVTTR